MRRALTILLYVAAAAARPLTRLVGPQQPVLASQNASCNVLALSGGGSFGAVEMGILDGLLASQAAPSQYDIITGISAGGLNAAFLSYYADVGAALPDIYGIVSNLTTASVYKSAFWDIFSGWSIYNNAPLEATLNGILTGKSLAEPTPITLIGATNVNSETLDVFRFVGIDNTHGVYKT